MRQFFSLLISIAFVASCSSVKVTADFDKNADFSKFKTATFLGWQENIDSVISNSEQIIVRDAFKSEMAKRNIQIVDADGDMAVTLFLVADQKTSTTAYTNYYGSGRGYGRYRRGGWGWGGGYATTTYSETDYMQGTLVVDVFDNESGDMIWQGVGTGTIPEKAEKRAKTIPKAVAAIMKEFPIAPTD
jgi:hypothetical protein